MRNPADGFEEQSIPERIQRIKKYSPPRRRVKQRKVVKITQIQTFKPVSSVKESLPGGFT